MSVPIDSTEEVLSGEAVAIDVLPLGFFMRVLGAAIDMTVGWLLFLLFFWIRIWVWGQSPLPEQTDGILAIVGFVVCFIVIPVSVEVVTGGRSLGKLAVGGRIVRLDGGAIGFRHAFIRGFLGFLEIYVTFGAVAVLCATFTARSQRLGDLVAGTYSQRVRTPKLVPQQLIMPPHLRDWAQVADVARLPDRLARRIAQFLQSARHMSPEARARISHELVEDASAYVSPRPTVDPEALLVAMTLVRQERERRALANADARAERLTGLRLGV